MSFLRHTEIYRSDVLTGFTPGKVPPPVDRHSARVKRRDGRSAPDFIVFDEFPAGYSSAGCSPAEPASASPTTASLLPPPIQAPHKTVEWYLCNQQVSQARGSVQEERRARFGYASWDLVGRGPLGAQRLVFFAPLGLGVRRLLFAGFGRLRSPSTARFHAKAQRR